MNSRTAIIPPSALLSIAVIGLVIWPFAPTAAFSIVSNNATATAETTNESTPPPDIQSASQIGNTGPVTSSVTADRGAATRFVVGHGFSSGTVDFGYFKGTADSQAIVPRGSLDTDGTGREFEHFAGSSAGVDADTGASFLVTPRNPALVGTVGLVFVSVDVHGTLSAALTPDPLGLSDGSAQVDWSMFVGTTQGALQGWLFGTVDSFGTGFGDMPGLHTLFFDVVLGVPTAIQQHYALHTTAGIRSALGRGGRAEGLAEFSSTFRWMGISQVLDFNGDPIDYSIESDAGFDLTQAAPTPVPVPPLSLLTSFLGIAALFARRRFADAGHG